jgi:hypothetical protein
MSLHRTDIFCISFLILGTLITYLHYKFLAAIFKNYFSWVVQVIWKARYKFQAPVFFVCIPWNNLSKTLKVLGSRPIVCVHIQYFIQEISVATSCLLSFASRTLNGPPKIAVDYQAEVTKAIFQIKGPWISMASMLVFLLGVCSSKAWHAVHQAA